MKLLKGNSYRLTCLFYDFGETVDEQIVTDPDLVKFIVMDEKFNQISSLTLTESNRVSPGLYQVDYTPMQTGNFYAEWYGEFLGLPSLHREKFEVRMV